MQLIEVYAKAKKLGLPVFQTRDMATYLHLTPTHTSKLLGRLCEQGLLLHLTRGLWGFADQIDRFALPTYLMAPFPTYVSLQTALYLHGMISQISEIIYAVSVGRTRVIRTELATVSIHHIAPDFFFGYEQKNDVNIATPEKALLDVFYLSPAKTRWFASLPELELPENFNKKLALKMINQIKYDKRRQIVRNRFESLMAGR